MVIALGYDSGDKALSEIGIAVLLSGVVLIFASSRLTPRRRTHGEQVNLSISDLKDARRCGLKWLDDSAGLWVGIYDLNIVHELNTRFILANTPPEHAIFFAVSAFSIRKEHEPNKELLSMLTALGDSFEEKVEHRKDRWSTVFASTRSEAVIRQIFDRYEFYYGTYVNYPFIVAKGQLHDWMESLKVLLDNHLKGLTCDMIKNSHCIMVTHWEHGLEMFTDKISEEEVVEVARDIAEENSLPLVNMGDEVDQSKPRS